jgi:Na+/H+ antiporter NhaD/arsenite permease-like protein
VRVGAERFAAFSILALTVSLSLARPRIGRIRVQHAIAGVLGAMLTVSLGIVPIELVSLAIKLLFFPVVTIVSLMVITLIAERAGLFDLLARSMAIGARGDGRRLFAFLFACGTVTRWSFSWSSRSRKIPGRFETRFPTTSPASTWRTWSAPS